MRIMPEQAAAFHCPRWEELPKLQLYMDQVILVLEETLSMFMEEKEPVVTSTMINNYVKQKVILPPAQKKYGREQLAQLMVVCLLKKVFSINEITSLMAMMMEHHAPGAAYDSFCVGLEGALKRAFAPGEIVAPVPAPEGDDALIAQNAALTALVGKLVVVDRLSAEAAKKPKREKAAAQKGAAQPKGEKGKTQKP